VFVGETEAIVDVLRINGLVPAVGSRAGAGAQCAGAPAGRGGGGRTLRMHRADDPRRAFRDRYGAVVLAVARNGEHIRGG
jgi:hypothetical protein